MVRFCTGAHQSFEIASHFVCPSGPPALVFIPRVVLGRGHDSAVNEDFRVVTLVGIARYVRVLIARIKWMSDEVFERCRIATLSGLTVSVGL